MALKLTSTERLANPNFGNVEGLGMLVGSAKAVGEQQKQRQSLFEQLMQNDPLQQAQAIQALGVEDKNPALILQGTKMTASANKQNALIEIQKLMDVYANPAKTKEERASALQQAENQAYSDMVGMTPQSFNSLVAGASGRHEKTLNTQANQIAATRGANAISEYSNLYGPEQVWRINQAVKNQTAVQNTLAEQSTNAFVNSKRGDIARLDTQISQYQTIPVEQWDMDSLRQLYNERFQIEQEVVARGGQGDPSQFVGGAARLYDDVFKVQSERKRAVQEEADKKIELQMDQLHALGSKQPDLTSNQFVDMIRERSRNAKVNQFANWAEKDWVSLEKKIYDSQEIARKRGEHIKNGTLASNQEDWLAKNPGYFSKDDEFTDALKVYRSDNSAMLAKINAGNVLTTKIKAAQAEQRQNERSDTRVKQNATDFVEAFIGAGDPDDLRFNPNMPVEGGFLQGPSVYDAIRRLQLIKDDDYNKLINKVGRRIKDNPNVNMREAVLDSFQELFIKTPGEQGIQLRQAEIAEQTEITRTGIKKLKEDYKTNTGKELSDADAAAIIQQQLADALLADSERMSSRVRAIREGTPARGEDPSTVPSPRDYAEIGLQGAEFIYDKTVVPAGRILRGEGLPAYDRTRGQ